MIHTDEKSQAEARDYVLNRPLTRPSTTWFAPISLELGAIIVGSVLGVVLGNLIEKYKPLWEIPKWACILATIGFFLFCVAKPVLILCIRCHQHYALESVRRSCMCKPTCSEYAILVLKKYCLVKALVLIYNRLIKTCTGRIYKIDFPDR